MATSISAALRRAPSAAPSNDRVFYTYVAIAAAVLVLALAVSPPALAHHGLGRFDRTKQVDFTGVIQGIDFVNPHSYLHFDADGADGKTIAMRCEMRAATL